MQIFQKYYEPSYKMLEHMLLGFAISICRSYQTLHLDVVGQIRRQQQKYTKLSILVLHLKYWQMWERHMRLFELVLFRFVLFALTLSVEYEHVIQHMNQDNNWNEMDRTQALAELQWILEISRTVLTIRTTSLKSQGMHFYSQLRELLSVPELMIRDLGRVDNTDKSLNASTKALQIFESMN